MTRAFALLFAAVTLLAGAGQAGAQGYQGGYRQGYQTGYQPGYQGGNRQGYQPGYQQGYQGGAQDFDMRDIMGGGPNFFQRGGGSSPIPRETVNFTGQYAPGTILINTAERRLYLVLGNGQALRYGIGVGRDGFRWGGVHRISAKKEWPSWTPPSQMLARRPDLPRHMAGGIDNPLGARAMYLGSTLYRIHGSNEPETIGQAVSSGCFRMTNEDVTDLYSRVSVGTTVVVKN